MTEDRISIVFFCVEITFPYFEITLLRTFALFRLELCYENRVNLRIYNDSGSPIFFPHTKNFMNPQLLGSVKKFAKCPC